MRESRIAANPQPTKSLSPHEQDITVVIPTLGSARVLRAAQSVCLNPRVARTVIVLDDSSNSESVNRLRNSLNGLPNVLVMQNQGPHSGASACRSIGLSEVETQWVSFLDDDDFWLPNRFSQRFPASANQRVVLLSRAFFGDGRRKPRLIPKYTSRLDSKECVLQYCCERSSIHYGKNALQTGMALIPTLLVRQINWDPTLKKHQDWDFFIRLAAADTRFIWLDEPGLFITQNHKGSISSTHNQEASLEFFDRHFLNDCRASHSRAAADFLFAIVMRGTLPSELPSLWSTLKPRLRSVPHLSALLLTVRSWIRSIPVGLELKGYTRNR